MERNHGTHQDRLIKKMRRKKIATHAATNEFLRDEYLPEHNRRFAVAAAAPEDYHLAKPRKSALDERASTTIALCALAAIALPAQTFTTLASPQLL